jgi:hypothetical protein
VVYVHPGRETVRPFLVLFVGAALEEHDENERLGMEILLGSRRDSAADGDRTPRDLPRR